jgi:hypothetical protein
MKVAQARRYGHATHQSPDADLILPSAANGRNYTSGCAAIPWYVERYLDCIGVTFPYDRFGSFSTFRARSKNVRSAPNFGHRTCRDKQSKSAIHDFSRRGKKLRHSITSRRVATNPK